MSLDHIGELPEVRRYFDDGKSNFMLHGGFGIRYIRESFADVALAAADREVGRLECCANCGHFETRIDLTEVAILRGCGLDEIEVDPRGCCPSRWTRKVTP